MGVCLTVFWAMRTPLRIGPNRSRCCNFIPSAAKLAQAVNWLVGFVVDSFMMMVLLSQVFFPLIGKIHHRSFRKSLCFDISLSLFWTKFRYIEIDCDGFEVETLIHLRILRACLKIVEVPSIEYRRIYGKSNLKAFRDGWRVLRTIVRERIRSFWPPRRLRFPARTPASKTIPLQ